MGCGDNKELVKRKGKKMRERERERESVCVCVSVFFFDNKDFVIKWGKKKPKVSGWMGVVVGNKSSCFFCIVVVVVAVIEIVIEVVA